MKLVLALVHKCCVERALDSSNNVPCLEKKRGPKKEQLCFYKRSHFFLFVFQVTVTGKKHFPHAYGRSVGWIRKLCTELVPKIDDADCFVCLEDYNLTKLRKNLELDYILA
jgi:hypothetical protein